MTVENRELNLLEEMLELVQPTAEELAAEGKLDPLQRTEIKRVLEALLFSSAEPIPFRKLRDVVVEHLPLRPRQLYELLEEMREEYSQQRRGFQLDQIGNGYLLRTRSEFADYIHRLHCGRRGERLSQAAAEVLAIVAYRQPITRPEIDRVRGVDSSGTLQSLLDRELVESVGRANAPGRPSLYATTPRFLQHFGLRSLDELPTMEPFRSAPSS